MAWPSGRGLAAAAVALAVAGTALIALGKPPSPAAPVGLLPRGTPATARRLRARRLCTARWPRRGGRAWRGGCCEREA